jgi:hypothetical protein
MNSRSFFALIFRNQPAVLIDTNAMFDLRQRRDAYLDALKAMHELLGALGEQHWRSWIAQDIEEWESRKSASHHLSAYGGMGSFNDIGFDDVWLDTLFQDLKASVIILRITRARNQISVPWNPQWARSALIYPVGDAVLVAMALFRAEK